MLCKALVGWIEWACSICVVYDYNFIYHISFRGNWNETQNRAYCCMADVGFSVFLVKTYARAFSQCVSSEKWIHWFCMFFFSVCMIYAYLDRKTPQCWWRFIHVLFSSVLVVVVCVLCLRALGVEWINSLVVMGDRRSLLFLQLCVRYVRVGGSEWEIWSALPVPNAYLTGKSKHNPYMKWINMTNKANGHSSPLTDHKPKQNRNKQTKNGCILIAVKQLDMIDSFVLFST